MDATPLIDPESNAPEIVDLSPEVIRKRKMVVIYSSSGVVTTLFIASLVLYILYPSTFVQIFSKSGFTAAFSLIFISEIGDKTFFIAALLAMKHSRIMVFCGTLAALALMTVISVVIGKIFSELPSSVTSIPIGRILAVILLVWFGVQSIIESIPPNFSFKKLFHKQEKDEEKEEDEENEEIQGAQAAIDKAEQEPITTPLKVFVEAFSLVFLAEWGDRSMLATIALAVAQSAVGVATGAIAGHFIATIIAVAGGALISKYISERLVKFIGGVLFLLFAVATAFDIY